MSQDQEDKRRQKEIDEARLEIVRDLHRSGEEFGKMAHQAFLRVRADMRRSREEMEEMDRQRLLQIAADIRKERLSRAILPRHKPINLADVILSHPPISTRMVRTLFGLPAHPAAPVEQDSTTQAEAPVKVEQRIEKKRAKGGRRYWGTRELRRERITEYLDYLNTDGAAKKRAIEVVGFGWRTIEGWPEWKEVVGE